MKKECGLSSHQCGEASSGEEVFAGLDAVPSAAFTPGPWRADKGYGCKRIMGRKIGAHKQAQYLTEVACTPGLSNEDEDRANARLIAAAPDMCAALIAADEILATWTGPWGFKQKEADRLVRAALTKALGASTASPAEGSTGLETPPNPLPKADQ